MRRICNKILSLYKKDNFPFEIEDCRAEISKKDTSGQVIRNNIKDVNPYLIRIGLNTRELGQQYKRYMHFYAIEELKKKKSKYIKLHKNGWKEINWDKLNLYVSQKLSH